MIMGLFEKVFPKKARQQAMAAQYFQMINGYQPVYTNYNGGVYEMMQTKAIINTIATDCGKAVPELAKHNKQLEYMLKHRPNPLMSTSAFIERVVTNYLCDNNSFIIPIVDQYDRTVGLFPISFQQASAIEMNNQLFIKYMFNNGKSACIEYDRVGHLRRMQKENDLFGDTNATLNDTLNIVHSQNESLKHTLKNSGALRFMAKLNEVLISEEDFEAERDLFAKINMGNNNKQMMLFDKRYEDIKQIDSKPIYLDEKQQDLIDRNLSKYFGVSTNVVEHKFANDYEWNSYYEGVIEPILIKLGEELTKMLFTPSQIASGSVVYVTSNRLQYMDNMTKLEYATQLRDRGVINGNQVCDILNLPHYEGGELYYIRKEYAEIGSLGEEEQGKIGYSKTGDDEDED